MDTINLLWADIQCGIYEIEAIFSPIPATTQAPLKLQSADALTSLMSSDMNPFSLLNDSRVTEVIQLVEQLVNKAMDTVRTQLCS